jgi:phenol hydroxylase P1 protein
LQYEIKTKMVEPKRTTFKTLVERFGDRPSSRYEEVSYDVQPTENFHYRPRWDPDHLIFDPDYTILGATDWEGYRDPRQYYYATYNQARASALEVVRANLEYLEENQLFEVMDPAWRNRAIQYLPAMRHFEYGAMLVLAGAARFSYGTALSQAISFACFDRMGNSELATRFLLCLSDDPESLLKEGKQTWLEDPIHQGLRRFIEHMLVVRDWAEQIVAMCVALDVKLRMLFYKELAKAAAVEGATPVSLFSKHFVDWQANDQRWVQEFIRMVLRDPKEGLANRGIVERWLDRWMPEADEAIAPYASLFEGTKYEGGGERALEQSDRAREELLAAVGLKEAIFSE